MKAVRMTKLQRIMVMLTAFALACGGIYLGINKVKGAITASAEYKNDFVIVLDAGHHAYVLNIVVLNI